jgi:cytochrome c oxidase subunit 3
VSEEPRLVVRDLPDYAFGTRDPMWWGVALLIAIEGTTLALTLLAYFYTRLQVDVWPTTAPGGAATRMGIATSVLLLASVLPAHRVNLAVYRGDLATFRRWMFVVTALSLFALGTRAFELVLLPFRWDSDAYGSLFWGMLVLQTTHVVLGVIENLVFCALLLKGPLEKKHLVDLEVNGFYWYFVVVGGVLVTGILYGEALVR